MNPQSYIGNLKIAYPKHDFGEKGITSSSLEAASDEEQAFVNNKTLVSFVSNISAEYREDVLNATLLAQLAADYAFPKEENLNGWYDKYTEVLKSIGWAEQGSSFQEFESSESMVEMQNVILEILGTALGSNYLAVVKKALDAIKALSDSDNKIVVFEKNTHSLKKGVFQIALADETNNSIALHMAGFILSASSEIKRILFFKSAKDNAQISYSTKTYTLNVNTYGTVRNLVRQKLGEKATSYIAEIQIA